MYLIDFLKRVSNKSNIPIMVYLILNVFFITFMMQILLESAFAEAFFISIVVYGISMLIALSPFGEWILRLQTGCKKMKRVEQINKMEPLFREVYDKARKLNPSIPEDVKLFINSDLAPNAFATGRKTICITEGLLSVSEGQIKATLAHELGHLAHKDTDLILLVSVGNFIVTAVIVFIRVMIILFQIIVAIMASFMGGAEGTFASLMNSVTSLLITLFVTGAMWVWTKIGILLVMKSRRENEYGADEFSFNLGYGNELCALLDNICESSSKGLFANLASSHPDKHERIAKLQALGATYRKNY